MSHSFQDAFRSDQNVLLAAVMLAPYSQSNRTGWSAKGMSPSCTAA